MLLDISQPQKSKVEFNHLHSKESKVSASSSFDLKMCRISYMTRNANHIPLKIPDVYYFLTTFTFLNFRAKIFSDVFSWISFFWFFFLFCSHFPFPLFSCFFLIFLFYLDFPFSPFFLNFLSFRFLIFPNFPLIFLSRFFSWWWTSVFNKRSEKLLKRAKTFLFHWYYHLGLLGTCTFFMQE